jgi:hypothetical protein
VKDCSAIAEHVAGCRACQAELAHQRDVAELARQGFPLHPAPPELRARVERLLARRPPQPLAWLAACAALVLATFLGARALAPAPPPLPAAPAVSELALLAARTHVRYTRGELPLDVRSERAANICGFFAGRVPFAFELRELPDEAARKPYLLTGARLVSVRDDPAAFVAYRLDQRPVSLLIASSATLRPAGGQLVASGKLLFHVELVDGLRVITWVDNGLSYALASGLDVPRAEPCTVCHAAPAERTKLGPLQRTRS